jgi:hypothetical protein
LQIGAILATGNIAAVEQDTRLGRVLDGLPSIASRVLVLPHLDSAWDLRAVLSDEGGDAFLALNRRMAGRDRPGPRVKCRPPTGDQGRRAP